VYARLTGRGKCITHRPLDAKQETKLANLLDNKKQRAELSNEIDNIVASAAMINRALTATETKTIQTHLKTINGLQAAISETESKNTLPALFRANGGQLFPGGSARSPQRKPSAPLGNNLAELPISNLSSDYDAAFASWVSSGGTKIEAALYEGSNVAGGYAVPVITDGEVVPLAPQEMAVRQLARVVPTTNDLKVPIKATFGTAAIKPESGSSESTFTDSDPTLGQFELTSFMVGRQTSASWELLQDVAQFQAFVVDDLMLSLQMYEESKYINGNGTTEPQGLIGNTGTGITGVANTGSALLDATYDVQASLNAAYHGNASFLMSRSTGVALRKAQKQANLFEPVFTRSNGQDYLHGYPVSYSASMPVMAASATPLLFGDFNAGYIIGDRGGAGISLKFLDQIKAPQGKLVLLAFRRTDGRVRRSEAIQAITIAAS
jgi:HK97 family phage major capsid protein